MLVRSRSDAGSVILSGDVAVTLLEMMGQSGVLPGALIAKDVPVARVERPQGPFPLIELLARAVEKECAVVWEEDRPLFQRKAPR